MTDTATLPMPIALAKPTALRSSFIIASDSLRVLLPAFAKAQGEFMAAAKDAVNPHLKNHYADLNSVMRACVPALRAHGLVILQPPASDGDVVTVTTIIIHADSGEYLGCSLGLRPSPNTAQGVGSAISYARRYSLQSLVGLLADDDDGAEASGQAGRASSASGRRPAAAPQAPPPAPSETAAVATQAAGLTLAQRAKVATARIAAKFGKEGGDERIAAIKSRYPTNPAGQVIESERPAYVVALEDAASK